MFVLGHFVSLAITRMRIKTLLAAAAAEPSGGGGECWGGGGLRGTGLPSRAEPAAARGRDDAGAGGAVVEGSAGFVGADTGRSPALPPGCCRGDRLGHGKDPPRQGGGGGGGGVHRRAGAQVCFVLLGFSPLFPFSSSVGLLGAAGLGEQRGHAKSKGSPDAGPCRGTTGGLLPHPSSPPARPGEPSPLPSEAPDFPGARQTLLAAVTRAQHRQGGQEWTGMDGAGGGGALAGTRGAPWHQWATAASHASQPAPVAQRLPSPGSVCAGGVRERAVPSRCRRSRFPHGSPASPFAWARCSSRKHRRDPRDGGSSGALFFPLSLFVSWIARLKRHPPSYPVPPPHPPRPREATGSPRPVGERGSGGHRRSQVCPLVTTDLLRNRWRR